MNNKKVDKKREQRILYEHEGWVKGYEEGREARKDEIQALQAVLEIKNATIKALSGKSPVKDSKGALDLAWELAHEVKEGQIIPEGTRYLEIHNSELREYVASENLKMTLGLVPKVRTHEPLPDPEPDWLDAPAVMARGKHWEAGHELDVFTRGGDMWQLYGCDQLFHWTDLTDVTPLWPKEDA